MGEEQIVRILRETSRKPVTEAAKCRFSKAVYEKSGQITVSCVAHGLSTALL